MSGRASSRAPLAWKDHPGGTDIGPTRDKIIDHPYVGRIGLDCDVLFVAGDDISITVSTAEPGTEDANNLDLAIVLGTQALVH